MITYNVGNILRHIECQPIFVGSGWGSATVLNSTVTVPAMPALETFLKAFVEGPFMDVLTAAGFGVGRGTVSPGAIDPVVLSRSTTKPTLEADIVARLQPLIDAGAVRNPGVENLYVLFVEPGCPVKFPKAGAVGTHMMFDGHDYYGVSRRIHYCIVAGSTQLVYLTRYASNEIVEACTDPVPGQSWCDTTLNATSGGGGGEVCDFGKYTTWNGYQVCAPRGPDGRDWTMNTPQPPLRQPANVKITPLSTQTARIEWDQTPNTLGYRIWFVPDEDTRVLWGETNAVTRTFIANAIPIGKPVAFMVEAYNRLTDGQAISVKMPASDAELQTVTIKGTYLSATSQVLLEWSAGWPVTLYRVYQGTGEIYEGTNTQLKAGVQAGSTNTWKVEASDISGAKATASVTVTAN